jgi:hypothetical protein
MSKHKKLKPKDAPAAEETPADPHDVLRHPANPPRPHLVALLIALALFFAWFVYLVYVAVVG